MKLLIVGDPSGVMTLDVLERGVNPSDITVWENTRKGLVCAKMRNVSVVENLEVLSGMQFDVIIGNPPYQGPDNVKNAVYVSIWTQFWSHSLRLLKPGGKISLITPLTWCAPGGQLRGKWKYRGMTRLWDVFNKFTTVAQIEGIDKHFKGVGSSFSVVSVDTSGSDGIRFVIPDENGKLVDENFDTSLGFHPLSGVDRVKAELSSTNNIGDTFPVSGKSQPLLRVSIPKTRKLTEESVEILQPGGTRKYDIKDSLCTFIYPNTMEEAERIRQRVLDCSDILYKHCRYNGFIDGTVMKSISV